MQTSKTLLAGALFTAALLLGACGPDADNPDATGDPTSSETAAGGGGDPGQDECLLGTWQVDVQDASDQVVALMAIPGVTAEAGGTITIEFAEDITVTHDNTLALTIPIGDTPMVGNAVYSGSSVPVRNWTAANGVIDGEPGENNVNIEMEFTAGGTTVPATIPPPELTGPGEGAAYTCSGDSATVGGQDSTPIWRLTRV
jgi:hypothetical protein